MKSNTKIILEKISHNSERYTNESARKGSDGEKFEGLPEGYVVEGNLLSDIAIGEPIMMQRTKRNGISADGVTYTSIVNTINGNIIETENSTYKITKLDTFN